MSISPKQLEMNEQFKRAIYCMEKTRHHLFITGKAGTGKSTLLAHFCKMTAKKPVVLRGKPGSLPLN